MNKQCTKCGNEYPATTEFYFRDRNRPCGLTPQCKVCAAKRDRKAGAERAKQKAVLPKPTHKHCPKCGIEYPLSLEYFRKNKNSKNGLSVYCKSCESKRAKARYESDSGKQKITANQTAYHAANKKRNAQLDPYADKSRVKTCNTCNKTLSVVEFDIAKTTLDGLAYHCKGCGKEKRAKEYAKNPQRHREISARHARERRKKYPEKVRQITRAADLRRRARKAQLLDDFTVQDWQYALEYFHHCCAVCGRQLTSLFGEFTAAADHFIPISKGGHTIPENIIPLCHGLGGCNNSKKDKSPQEWLEQKYGKRKAREILQVVSQFFASVRQTREDKSA